MVGMELLTKFVSVENPQNRSDKPRVLGVSHAEREEDGPQGAQTHFG